MRVAVFGAHGKVGLIVVQKLLMENHEVLALVHRKSFDFKHPDLTVIQGDIYDTASLKPALVTVDAVISTLGSWGTPRKDVLNTFVTNVLPLLNSHHIKRFISLTGADAQMPGETTNPIHLLSHSLLLVAARKVLTDSEKHIALLQESNLDWTVLRSPIMTNRGKPLYRLADRAPLPWTTINRYAVAHALVAQLEDRTYNRKSPFIVRS